MNYVLAVKVLDRNENLQKKIMSTKTVSNSVYNRLLVIVTWIARNLTVRSSSRRPSDRIIISNKLSSSFSVMKKFLLGVSKKSWNLITPGCDRLFNISFSLRNRDSFLFQLIVLITLIATGRCVSR